MKTLRRTQAVVVIVILATLFFMPNRASAADPSFVVVRWGDTLFSIAARYNTTVDALVSANGLPNANFIFVGQRLVIRDSAPTPRPATKGVYMVRAGDTLFSIAVRNGTTVKALMLANGIANPNFIYTGERLNLPTMGAPVSNPTPSPPVAVSGGKWIDVNIRTQTITAYEGTRAIRSALVSTGVANHPTPAGRFAIYVKYKSQTMTGGSKASNDYYYLPNVPNVMYFYRDYALHGTYWHKNFGRPMSRGCVNLTLADAEWFFSWAPLGTAVVSHY
jgi:LysM repeat protein